MVDNKNFKDMVVNGLQNLCGNSGEVSLHDVYKNNNIVYSGVIVRVDGENMSQIIYLESYYEKFCKGTDIETIVREIFEIWKSRNPDNVKFDLAKFKDYDNYKDKIVIKLINHDTNERLLQDVPHKAYLDMAVVFYVLMNNYQNENMTFLVYNKHLELWNINADELYETAMENSLKLLPCKINTLSEVVSEILGREDDEILPKLDKEVYVATNSLKSNGAAVITYPNALKDLSKSLNKNLVILPSSIHECIIVPSDNNMEFEALRAMVVEVNRNEVSREDFLSDNIYFYDKEKEQLSIIKMGNNV